MSDYKLTGVLKIVFDKQTFDSGFEKREIVVETPGEYPQDIKLEILKDKCDKIKKEDEGKVITVAFNLRGREYNGNYYNNLVAWKWNFEGGSGKDKSAFNASPEELEEAKDGTGDGLPF